MLDVGMVAVVTGASKGIGRAVARDLLSRGVHVVGTSRKGDGFDGIAGASAQNARFVGVASDVRVREDNRALVEKTLAEFGRLDILVNNAGLGRFANLVDLTYEQWDEMMLTNLGGVFSLTHETLPTMIAAHSGAIVMIGSLASRNTFPGGTGYCASKWALLGLTECLLMEVREHNIRATIVMPGSVATDFHKGSDQSWMLTAEDVAASVAHVLSSAESAFVSKVELRPYRVKQ